MTIYLNIYSNKSIAHAEALNEHLDKLSVLLNKIMVSIPKDLVAIKILSINIDDVIGLLGVTNKKQQSILEAIIWENFDRLTDFLII